MERKPFPSRFGSFLTISVLFEWSKQVLRWNIKILLKWGSLGIKVHGGALIERRKQVLRWAKLRNVVSYCTVNWPTDWQEGWLNIYIWLVIFCTRLLDLLWTGGSHNRPFQPHLRSTVLAASHLQTPRLRSVSWIRIKPLMVRYNNGSRIRLGRLRGV